MMPSTYTFIVPAYNESERLEISLPKILDYVRKQQLRSEIIVVNDGSTDDTAEVVRRFMAVNADIRLVENPGNRGKGYSVRHGMLQAQGDVVLFTDADLSSPIYEAGKLFAAIEKGADVAIGSRWLQSDLQTERQPWHRQLYGRSVQPGPAAGVGIEVSRHTMRVQSVYAGRGQRQSSPVSGWSDGASIRSCCSLRTSFTCARSRFRWSGRTITVRRSARTGRSEDGA